MVPAFPGNSEMTMKVLAPVPQISADRRSLTFELEWKGQTASCTLSRTALEVYFWLPRNADEARMVKVFQDGFRRIHAVALRTLLARPSVAVELDDADFARK
jgi:hypothetical protein